MICISIYYMRIVDISEEKSSPKESQKKISPRKEVANSEMN